MIKAFSIPGVWAWYDDMISHDMISHETSRVFEIQQINAAGATKFGAFGAWILKYVIEHTTNVNFQGKGASLG